MQAARTICPHLASRQPLQVPLNPKPRDFTSAQWQQSVNDDHLKKIILGGGASVGKSESMPANPNLAAEPDVVDGLVALIRSFGRAR